MQAINAKPPTTPPTIPPTGTELGDEPVGLVGDRVTVAVVVTKEPGVEVLVADRVELVTVAVAVTVIETETVPGGLTNGSVATGMLRISIGFVP